MRLLEGRRIDPPPGQKANIKAIKLGMKVLRSGVDWVNLPVHLKRYGLDIAPKGGLGLQKDSVSLTLDHPGKGNSGHAAADYAQPSPGPGHTMSWNLGHGDARQSP